MIGVTEKGRSRTMADATHKNVRGTPAENREYDIKDTITSEVGKTD